jgi:hypothetical protein
VSTRTVNNALRKGPAVGHDFEAILSAEPKNRAFVVSDVDRIETDRINSRDGTPRLVERYYQWLPVVTKFQSF